MPDKKVRTRFAPSPTGYMHVGNLRTSMHLDSDAKLEIFVEGDSIILKKYRPNGSCDFCGEVDPAAVVYKGYCICPACRKKISKL